MDGRIGVAGVRTGGRRDGDPFSVTSCHVRGSKTRLPLCTRYGTSPWPPRGAASRWRRGGQRLNDSCSGVLSEGDCSGGAFGRGIRCASSVLCTDLKFEHRRSVDLTSFGEGTSRSLKSKSPITETGVVVLLISIWLTLPFFRYVHGPLTSSSTCTVPRPFLSRGDEKIEGER